MSEANKALARRYFEDIFNGRNLAACDEILSKSFVEHAAPPLAGSAPGKVDGPASMRATAEGVFAQLPDIHMTVESVVAEGDEVAVRVLAEGTPAPVDGAPAGARFAAGQMHWFRVSGGKLAEHWAVRDDLGAALQLYGVHPAAAPTKRAPRTPRSRS